MIKRENYILNGIQYLQCGKCLKIKSIDMFSNLKHWFLWKRSWCRICCAEYKKSNKDYFVKYNKEYYASKKNDIQKQQLVYRELNRERINNKEKEYYNSHANEIITKNIQREKEKWYSLIHRKAREVINRLWIRPKVCPICWLDIFNIEAHHPNNDIRNEIVFCCKGCHKKIHSWKLQCPKPIDLLKI